MIFLFSCQETSSIDDNTIELDNLSDTILRDISYGNLSIQVFDLHLPANRDINNTPIILMIHGGAWKAGKKEDFNSYINLIKKKWPDVAIINMNYRLASNQENIHHNEIMEDINSVVNHIIKNKSKYQISENMGVIGASAGGQLAMIYAYKYNKSIKCIANIFGPSIINDWSWYNSTNIWLGGYVGDILTEYVGQPWDTLAYKAVSPYWNISSQSQPTIIFHGNLDPIVPVYQSKWMHGKLESLNVTTQYHEYFAFHSFDNAQSDEVINKLVAFFKTYL
ncbi:MAG: alpha/beta hydrolase [Saprospiraceae bacterium]